MDDKNYISSDYDLVVLSEVEIEKELDEVLRPKKAKQKLVEWDQNDDVIIVNPFPLH